MEDLELIIANKKYSSWSMRPWLALKVKEIAFKETMSLFDVPNNSAHFAEFSPTKKVPVLKHGSLTIWDSLAILEYVAELFPDSGLWPGDMRQRAHARAIANEIHSGFPALREECPMNMAREKRVIDITEAAKTDIKRIETIWQTCLGTSGGPFLFGEFTIADAMFAPIINRFEKYVLSDSVIVAQYSKAMTTLAAWLEWEQNGIVEPWICQNVEK